MKVKMKHQYMIRSGKLVEMIEIINSRVHGIVDCVLQHWDLKGVNTRVNPNLDLIRITLRDSGKPTNKYAKAFVALPECYDWLAMDSDDYWWAHKSNPKMDEVAWISQGGAIEVNLPPVKNWRKSLKCRQDYIPS